jgi:hypothetical protein
MTVRSRGTRMFDVDVVRAIVRDEELRVRGNGFAATQHQETSGFNAN